MFATRLKERKKFLASSGFFTDFPVITEVIDNWTGANKEDNKKRVF